MELDRTERRILGSLIEKRWTTPEQYPLSLNALVAACNQKSNREPKLELEVFEIEGALLALRARGLVFTREKDGGRVIRYDERLGEKLALDRFGSAVIAELMLRGPQTSPELLRRGGRMAKFTNMEQTAETLRSLGTQGLVRLLPRQSGQRHARWGHLLAPSSEEPESLAPSSAEPESPVGTEEPESPPGPRTPPAPSIETAPSSEEPESPAATPPPESPPETEPPPEPGLAERVAALEAEVADLRERLARLSERAGSPPSTPPTSASAPE